MNLSTYLFILRKLTTEMSMNYDGQDVRVRKTTVKKYFLPYL